MFAKATIFLEGMSRGALKQVRNEALLKPARKGGNQRSR
jgi:hypothetical protein